MEQLKMYWLKGTPFREYQLPEGYTVTNFKTAEDKLAWLECCRECVLSEDTTAEAFDKYVLSRTEIIPERDVFFLDYFGEHIGTVTAYVHASDGLGDMHMVGIKPAFRGKGLAKILNMITFRRLANENMPFIELTTDDWRLGAIKSYLNDNFYPVEYGSGMEERWSAVLEKLGIDGAEMLNEDATPFKTVLRKELKR